MVLTVNINKSEFASVNQDSVDHDNGDQEGVGKVGRKFKSIYRFLAWLVFSTAMMFASAASAQVIDIETFGTGSYPGPALQSNQTTYTYNAPAQPANYPNIVMDGQYVIATNTQQGFSSWASIGDNTTGSGYMMLINADNNQSGEFYRAQIPLTANTSFDFVTYLVTANSQGDYDFCTNNEGGLVLPNVTMQIEDGVGGVIASLDTGPIPFNPTPEWGEYKINFATDAVTTSVELVLINNSVGGCGNDLAIDDITFQVAVTMEAFDDSVTLTNTDTAQFAVLTLGANDNLDGNPLPGTELYFTATGSSLPSGISLNGSTGEVGVAAGTPEGTYTFDYEVCETSNKYNCSIATATIIVAFPKLPIAAADDTGSVADSSFGDASVLNVLDNDSIDNVTSPTAFDLSISAGSSLPSALTFDVSTGEVGVLPGAPSGLYSFDYDICEAGDPANCETATVTIDVTNPNSGGFCPVGTASIPGTYYVTSATGGQNANRTIGLPLAEGTSETGNNTGITYFGPITMDLTGDPTILAAEGDIIEISLSSAWNNQARAEILMSADGVTYTSLGTAGNGGSVYGAWTSNIMRYDDFVVPAGGARYVQVLQQNQGVRVDGVTYGTQCAAAAPTEADLVTVKSLSSASATPSEGDVVTFEIEVTNDGGAEATGVSLTDLLPAGLTATNSNGTVSTGSYDSSSGLWTLGTLANGASATLIIEGIVDAGQVGNTITNTLADPASGNQPDPSTVGDNLTESITIIDPNTGGGGFCPVGATSVPGTYFVNSATGGNSANNAVGMPLAEGSNETGGNSAATYFGAITMDLTGDPAILAAEGETIEVVLTQAWNDTARAEILMSADGITYTSLGTAGNGGSVYGAWTPNIIRYDDFVVPAGGARYVQVLRQTGGVRVDGVIYGTQCTAAPPSDVDLVTVKTLSSATATPSEGDTVTFVIEVSNNGTGEATGVSLTDLIPAGLTATGVNGTVSSGAYDAGTGLWTLGTLADGASATLTIEGTVDAGQGGNAITNTLASAASGDQTDPTTDGDDLTETVNAVTPVIEAVDNDFTAAPIAPGLGSVTASIFDNDTLNGAAFTPTAVTATITDDGSLFGATINPDGTIDIPASVAPGIYQLVYEICDVNDPSNCDTASVTIAVQAGVVDTHTQPDVCGAFLSQAWVTHGKLNLHDTEVRFGSGDFETDPYLYLPIERDAEGRISTYFGGSSGTDSGTISTPAGNNVASTRNDEADHESDLNTLIYRLDGAPGSTLTASLNTRGGQDYTAYWIEDSASNVISTSDFQFTTGTPNIGGVGEALPLSFTVPDDGVAYVYAVIFDPSASFGRPIVSDYVCPAPSLSMTKIADSEGPYVAGEVVTYTYTVTNDGNQNIRDVAITDTHNGSNPAPTPTNETLLTDEAPIGDSIDAGADNSWDVLAPGDTITFTGTYTITATDAANL